MRRYLILVVLLCVGLSLAPVARADDPGAPCADPFPATRDPANPLMLPQAPGANPLNGARFFVDGPRHGAAAGGILQLLHLDPGDYPDDYSWAQFQQDLDQTELHRTLLLDPLLLNQVQLLEKIAREPEEQRISAYSWGGDPGMIRKQVNKVMCRILTADPGTIPIITTYLLYQVGYCETRKQILTYRPRFRRQVRELAAGIENRPAVVLLELDAIGSSGCMAGTGALRAWEADLRYEINQISALPHTVVYVEGGYSDAMSVRYTARALRAVGIHKIQGFFTNDTHNQWTINEIRWAQAVSRRTGGAHIIVNTADNGRGPKLNPHPVWQGVEDLCNAPGRGMGIPPTTNTGFSHVDAFLWTGPPGNSSGHCRGGPDSGTWWLARALELSAAAQAKIGPGYPNNPY